MNTILAPRPARQVAHQSCGFCGAAQGQAPGRCHDRDGQCLGTH